MLLRHQPIPMRTLGIIPARYASTRFPGKALVDIMGKSMVRRTWERAGQAKRLGRVVVATDHPEIEAHVRAFGGAVVMTRPEHPSGTDRCYEALGQVAGSWDAVVNIQGDEPFIHPEQIDQLVEALAATDAPIATLVRAVTDPTVLTDPNAAKVVRDARGRALYFSRHGVPFRRDVPPTDWLRGHTYYQHVGMYAYRLGALAQVVRLPPSPLERAESLEQLRWLEAGIPIQTEITEWENFGIDTPEDLARIEGLAGARDAKSC
ncbi:MAG: 3-deoxy-manno-octulosonate cytidylyltransferase [Catalinimonas sp.]